MTLSLMTAALLLATSAPLPLILTDRENTLLPPVPLQDDAFLFTVYGDRTGGPAEGIEVLRQAVKDTVLIDPDLVMTVGDLIQGYNTRPEWMREMTEFRTVMDGLSCPWYPVAGNHDIYWRGPDRPPEEHEADYEAFFGPLWYAFDHKDCRFIALYTDEGNPETGQRSFSRPDCQEMSATQKAWLAETLESAKDKRHVFVFCHHPRWRGGQYGDDWNEVHDMLAQAGNVTAVFSGHVHRLQHDGQRDGIEYLSLATVGGGLPGGSPAAVGHLHHITLVMVRDEGIAMATIPVGTVIDPRAMTVSHHAAIASLMKSAPGDQTSILVEPDGRVDTVVPVALTNPLQTPVTWTIEMISGDPRWRVRPAHHHQVLEPGTSEVIPFQVRHEGPLDGHWSPPQWRSTVLFQDAAGSWEIPGLTRRSALKPSNLKVGAGDGCLHVKGGSASAIVDSQLIPLPDGSLTLEAWIRPENLQGRRGLVAKTESSEYGLFGSDGRPSFHVLLGDQYAEVYAESPLEHAAWSHVAGVYDHEGGEVRLYINGSLVASQSAQGSRRRNAHPLVIGGDVDAAGTSVSGMTGQVDEVRLSSVARYEGSRFSPAHTHTRDDDTVLLLHLNQESGPFVADDSGREAWGTLISGAEIAPANRHD